MNFVLFLIFCIYQQLIAMVSDIFMSNMVFEAFDRQEITQLLLLDLSKALDIIDRKTLSSNCKLRVLGVPEKPSNGLGAICRTELAALE